MLIAGHADVQRLHRPCQEHDCHGLLQQVRPLPDPILYTHERACLSVRVLLGSNCHRLVMPQQSSLPV